VVACVRGIKYASEEGVIALKKGVIGKGPVCVGIGRGCIG